MSDGERSYSWDAENRLVGITYPGTPGKATPFAYDGLDRRTAIARTPAGGGSAVTTSYLWCGSAICQARDAANDVTREYYAEGELVPGTSPATYYYGPDQIGSVRRVFARTSNALKCECLRQFDSPSSSELSLVRSSASRPHTSHQHISGDFLKADGSAVPISGIQEGAESGRADRQQLTAANQQHPS